MSRRRFLYLLKLLFHWSVVSFWFWVSIVCIWCKISLWCRMWLCRPRLSCNIGRYTDIHCWLSSWCYNCTGGCQNWASLRSCLVFRRDLLGTVLEGWGTCGTTWMFVATTSCIYLVKLWFLHGLHASLARLCCIRYKSILFLSGFFAAFSFLLLRFSTCIPFLLALFSL